MICNVRQARVDDAEAFSPMLGSLGYPCDPSFLSERISLILQNPDAVLLVVTSENDQAVGVLSLHFIPQLGIQGDVARIGFFVVDENYHGFGVGKVLETYAEKLSRDRGCDRMASNSSLA
jgi:GNAT superfamily N-acetyltransferase